MVDINEIKTEVSSPIIAAVESCPFPKSAIHKKRPYIPTRDLWYQKYTVSETYSGVQRKIEPENKKEYEIGEEIASIEAVNMPSMQSDVRPRVFDNITKSWTLFDSGSCVSCIPREPGDKIDPSYRLRAVNGQSIPTFGSKVISVRIGRKEYQITAIKTDISQRIIGWDLFVKYKLGFEWNQGELFLTDKKAKIKSLLKFIVVDPNTNRVEAVDCYEEPQYCYADPQTTYFETSCMQALVESTNAEETYGNQVNELTIHPDQPSPIALDDIPLRSDIDPEADEAYEVNLKALEQLPEPYKSLVKKYSILKADFKKQPAEDIYHRIETTGQPFKSKMRPILASSEKSKMGKKSVG